MKEMEYTVSKMNGYELDDPDSLGGRVRFFSVQPHPVPSLAVIVVVSRTED
jgi:hypothetical protein